MYHRLGFSFFNSKLFGIFLSPIQCNSYISWKAFECTRSRLSPDNWLLNTDFLEIIVTICTKYRIINYYYQLSWNHFPRVGHPMLPIVET